MKIIKEGPSRACLPGKSNIKRYMSDYKFNSLFVKNLLLLFVLILVPILGAVGLAYYAYNNMQRNDIKAYNERALTSAYTGMEQILEGSQKQMIYLGINSDVELFMYDNSEIKELNYKIKTIVELMRLPVISENYVSSIYIHSYKSNKVIGMNGLSDYDSSLEKSRFEQYEYQQGKKKQFLLTVNPSSSFHEKQVTVFQELRYGALTTGIVMMNLYPDEMVKKLDIRPETQLYVTDGNRILFSSDLQRLGEPVDAIGQLARRKLDGTVVEKDYCLSSKVSAETGLELISSFDLHKYRDNLSTVRNFMLLFLLVMVLVTIVLSVLISVRLFTPIETILASIRQYNEELRGQDEAFKEKDELMYILHSIQKTVNRKRDVEEELVERLHLLKKAQAVALQSQINPHFLNNTLETVNWTAISLLGGKNEVSEIVSALSSMLRMSLGNTDTIIPLRDEIRHCQSYLEIQKRRYENRFEVAWEIPEELYECKTIRMILQPIVENAIYHGMKHLSNKGLICISGRKDGEIVEIRVEDNGLGMTETEVHELNKIMQSEMIKESRHIGIANVNQRLKLYFGEESGIIIDSAEGSGTVVIMKFPCVTGS